MPSLGSALFGGTLALSQVWLCWVAPILGAVIGGTIARRLQREHLMTRDVGGIGRGRMAQLVCCKPIRDLLALARELCHSAAN